MADAYVKDPTLWKLDDRLAFSTSLFHHHTGANVDSMLGWDTPVELLSRGQHRSRIRTEAGDEGWVLNEHVVEIKYIGRDRVSGKWRYSTPLYKNRTGSTKRFYLLWGDRVEVVEEVGSRSKVRARGWTGWVKNSVLDGESLLELYFIDVGQGDGVLIRTPDDKHLLIDGGYTRVKQPTNKSAADFVDWKFFDDYGATDIHLDVMMASHCDADHYGGLWDLLRNDPESTEELDSRSVAVDAFYHAGVSWWRPGDRWLGRTQHGHLIDLLEDHASIVAGLDQNANQRLQGEWADFLERLAANVQTVRRVGVGGQDEEAYLPGFEPAAGGPVSIRVLAPIVRTMAGGPAVKDLGDHSQNTNGHSIALQLRHGSTKILLTGDLNKMSQHELLAAYSDDTSIFACDVAKGCHHGSDDVSYSFLQAVNAAATVISSGDNEGHAHPRPSIVAASALTGHRQIDTANDELATPLIYMTEVERSVAMGEVFHMVSSHYPHAGGEIEVQVYAVDPGKLDADLQPDAEQKGEVESQVHYKKTTAGAIRPEKKDRRLDGSYIVAGIVYGLVNVRTDGDLIVCATMNEAKKKWNIHTFRSRF